MQRIREGEGQQKQAVEVVQFKLLQRELAKDEKTSPVRLDEAIARGEFYRLLNHHKLLGMVSRC